MMNYNKFEILLHDIFLGKKIILKSIYELEKLFFLKKVKYHENKHIFITGLPRSGTTALLNFLDSFDGLDSLKYRNMPLVLSPNFSKIVEILLRSKLFVTASIISCLIFLSFR